MRKNNEAVAHVSASIMNTCGTQAQVQDFLENKLLYSQTAWNLMMHGCVREPAEGDNEQTCVADVIMP
jgi:fructose-1,6-bisphosphatase